MTVSAGPAVLVIAATDSSGGAGVARDARVLGACGVDVLLAVTAVTAQSNAKLISIHTVPPDLVREQIRGALDTRAIGAVKIGVLATRETVVAVLESLQDLGAAPIVLDPVLASSSGGVLLDEAGQETMRERLFPLATLITPNIPEAAALLGEAVAMNEAAMREQGHRLLRHGPAAVLIKGGHASGAECADLLVAADGSVARLASPRRPWNMRGTGCALSSAIAAGLAKGLPILEACRAAKDSLIRELDQPGSG